MQWQNEVTQYLPSRSRKSKRWNYSCCLSDTASERSERARRERQSSPVPTARPGQFYAQRELTSRYEWELLASCVWVDRNTWTGSCLCNANTFHALRNVSCTSSLMLSHNSTVDGIHFHVSSRKKTSYCEIQEIHLILLTNSFFIFFRIVFVIVFKNKNFMQ